ncbi:hypothetical protein F5Y04DRAFT_240858 [Hypomontagnella monticulosa]|nr:hypothetical protein F5Y04DRAFT_240858 [Hypomontagnella monticulosa]
MAMSKRTTFTTISPLPPGITREVVVDFLHNHVEMIDLNPLVIERHPISPPSHAPEEEQRCVWWSMTDKISYLPGGVVSGDVTYTAAFNDLPNGIQTHVYAPMGTDIRERWSLNGSLPGEPREPVELGIGAPAQGLYLREDVELRCNFVMSSFVKKTLKKAHGTLVERLLQKSRVASRQAAGAYNLPPSLTPPVDPAAAPPPPAAAPGLNQPNHNHHQRTVSAHSASIHSAHSSMHSAISHPVYTHSPHNSTSPAPAPYQGHARTGSSPFPHGHGPGRATPPPAANLYRRSPAPSEGSNHSFIPEPLRVNKNRASPVGGSRTDQPLPALPPGEKTGYANGSAAHQPSGIGSLSFPAELE